MSDPAEEKWKLELVIFIVNTVSKKKKKNYKQELTSAKVFVLHSEKLSINLLVMFSAMVPTCYPPIFYSTLWGKKKEKKINAYASLNKFISTTERFLY